MSLCLAEIALVVVSVVAGFETDTRKEAPPSPQEVQAAEGAVNDLVAHLHELDGLVNFAAQYEEKYGKLAPAAVGAALDKRLDALAAGKDVPEEEIEAGLLLARRLCTESLIPVLKRVAKNEKVPEYVRCQALTCLGLISGSQDILKEFISSDSDRLRAAAVSAYTFLADDKDILAVCEAFKKKGVDSVGKATRNAVATAQATVGLREEVAELKTAKERLDYLFDRRGGAFTIFREIAPKRYVADSWESRAILAALARLAKTDQEAVEQRVREDLKKKKFENADELAELVFREIGLKPKKRPGEK